MIADSAIRRYLITLIALVALAGCDAAPTAVTNTPVQIDYSAADVSAIESRINAVHSKVEIVSSRIIKVGRELDAAKYESYHLPAQLAGLRAEVNRLTSEISISGSRITNAESAYGTYFASMESLKADAREKATIEVSSHLESQITQISSARKQREAERHRLGAVGSGQSEAQLQSVRFANARKDAEAEFAEAVRNDYDRINNEKLRLSSAWADANATKVKLERLLGDSNSQLLRLSQTFERVQSQLKTLPTELSQLEIELESLLVQKADLSDQLFAAREDVRRKDEIAAAEKVRQQPYVSYQPVYSSSGSSNSSSGRTGSRYYDTSYRPPTSDSYVKPYFRKDGTFVQGHMRSNADDSFWNNFTSRKNINPHTRQIGTKKPPW